jgi:23S rRNA pseudouridine1911/1915/1917 synthase
VSEPEDAAAPAATAADRASAAEPFAIAYEDEHLLVIDKAAGVVVHPAKGHREDTLSQLLAQSAAAAPGTAAPAGGDPQRAGIVHRLDRDTSGLLVVARSEGVHAKLQRALQRREIEREYLALVLGRPPARSGTIEAPIGRDPRVRTRMAVGGAHPREARTHFQLERALPEHSLLRLKLETGRTHQIRVHLQAIGHPVAGDPEYGGRGALGLRRQFLHAARLAFAHPLSGAPIDVSSPLPADLREALARAERLS